MKTGNLGSFADQRGAALVISVLALVLIGVLAVAFMSTGATSQEISQNSHEQTEAFFISEAGLAHGSKLIASAATSEYTSILQAGDGVPGTGDELSTRPSVLTPVPSAGIAFGAGTYRVFVINDPAEIGSSPTVDVNKRLVVRSLGTGADGATVTTEALLAVSSSPAILVNGRLLINGNPQVFGSDGAIHANGPMSVSGNPCVEQYVSSSSTVTVSGTVNGGGCAPGGTRLQNQPIITPPTWDIRNDFRSRADFVMGIDGRVRDSANVVIHNSSVHGNDWNLAGGGKWTWDSSNSRWVHGGGALPDNKTWYSAGNMELGSDFGSTASPKPATFIAEGSITVSANPIVRGNPNLESGRFAFMAGKDLTLNGNPSSGYSSQGIHYCGDQLKLNGNPRIAGVLIAANLTDSNSPGGIGNPVPLSSGRMELSGNAQVTYDGSLIAGQARMLSWREVRN